MSPPVTDPFVELRALSKAYREGDAHHVVLDRVDAAFAAGEIVALLGRSGSGKSTLLNLVAGIDLPDAGDVVVDGRAINRLEDVERTHYRRGVGFVFQFFNLVPTLTVEENLLLPLELARGRLDDEERRRAVGLLDRVGLASRRGSFPDRLSGGEQQRVALARAVAHRPGLVLADEPTGNLDAETGRTVLDLLVGLARDEGTTLLMATHSRAVASVADRVLQIESARLLEVDLPPEEA